jgi:division protein CdvB (Snf7/Vps24/ESCRT-III family)
MRFDTNSSTPKLTFKPARFLETDDFNTALEQGKSPDAIRAITMTVAQVDKVTDKDDGEEFEQVAKVAPKKAAPVAEAEDETPEPVKRASKKEEAPAPKKDVSKILEEWDDE